MSTLNEMISHVRTERLFSPRPQQPSLLTILGAVITHTQNLYNELSNTNKAWATGQVSLNVEAGKDTYLLPVDSQCGKVLSVFTYQPDNPNQIERSVDFFEVQNLQFDWGLPNNVGVGWSWNWDGSPHTADRIAFYYGGVGDSGGLYARIKPIPQQPAEYKILYTIGNWAETAGLHSSPILSGHHQLIEVRGARTVLPGCVWFDDDEKDTAKQEKILITLNGDEQIFQATWMTYIRTLKQHKMTYRRSAIDY